MLSNWKKIIETVSGSCILPTRHDAAVQKDQGARPRAMSAFMQMRGERLVRADGMRDEYRQI